MCGGSVLTKAFVERPLVTSCSSYDCVLTFDLLSKYWIRSSIHRGLIGVSQEALSHLNTQLWGGGCNPPCVHVWVCVSACRHLCVMQSQCVTGRHFSVQCPCTRCLHNVYVHLSHLCWYVCFICVRHLSRSLWFLYPTAGLNQFTVSSTNLGIARCPRPSTEATVLPPLPCAKVHSPSLAGTNLVRNALLS